MKFLCITTGQYPHNDASSQRLHLLSCMLTDMGHEVEVICRNKSCSSGRVGNVEFVSAFSLPRTFFGKVFDMYSVFHRFVKQKVICSKPDGVLLVRAPVSLAQWLIRNAKIYQYNLFHDCTEWYSKEEFKHPWLSYEYLKKEFWMKYLFPKDTGIIAISEYIQDYFQRRGNRCIRIPSVCDSKSINCNVKKSGDKLIIVYAGTPGMKDRFNELIEALLELDPVDRSRLLIRIIGASMSQIADNAAISLKTLSSLDGCIQFCGTMSREDVYKNLYESDFTVLIRPDGARYAKAGFPTKIPEGMAAGTPPICNLTSDLGKYLDNTNSVIIKECSTSAVLESIRNVLSLNQDQIEEMKKNTRKAVERYFDYRIYKESLDAFVRSF